MVMRMMTDVMIMILFLLCKGAVVTRLCAGHRHSSCLVVAASALQSRVTRLLMERRFSFQAGDYVFINIPAISR